jgi:putative phage-type endonuclease
MQGGKGMSDTILLPEPPSRESWLAARRHGIGGSDIAAVCGLSDFADACPLAVYLDKLGLLPDRDSVAKRSGRMLEDVAATRWEEETGLHALAFPPFCSVVHPDYPWALSTPDRAILEESDAWLEIKTSRTGAGYGEEDTDQLPTDNLLQAHWQLFTGRHRGIQRIRFAVLVAGQDLRRYVVEESREMQERLWAIARDFWRLVCTRTPPEPDWQHPATPELLQLLHRPRHDTPIELDHPVREWVDLYQQAGEQIREAEKSREFARAKMAVALGDAAAGFLPDGTTIRRREITVKAGRRAESQQVRWTIKAPPRGRKG